VGCWRGKDGVEFTYWVLLRLPLAFFLGRGRPQELSSVLEVALCVGILVGSLGVPVGGSFRGRAGGFFLM